MVCCRESADCEATTSGTCRQEFDGQKGLASLCVVGKRI